MDYELFLNPYCHLLMIKRFSKMRASNYSKIKFGKVLCDMKSPNFRYLVVVVKNAISLHEPEAY